MAGRTDKMGVMNKEAKWRKDTEDNQLVFGLSNWVQCGVIY